MAKECEYENQGGTITAAMREAYEAKAGLEAVERAGRNPNLKGIVHEVLVKDSINANPENILNGTKAVLSKSTTAVRDDVLMMQRGKVVGRMQLKDTPASIGKTIEQVRSHHYAGTQLKGTKETTEAFAKAAAKKGGEITQKMTSSGVSSSDTARIAAALASTGAATVLAATAAPFWIPAAVGLGTAVAIGSAVKSVWDSIWR